MTGRNDDEWPDEIEHDPRWEVQPQPHQDDDPGSNVRAALIAAVTMAAVGALLVWLVIESRPGF